MARYRVFYAKRAGACFVPHIVMPTVFSRSAARAGVVFKLTEGFSPHAKISFGSELPVGVVALNEPADVWLEHLDDDLFERWKLAMPEGFSLQSYQELPEGTPSIGKSFPLSRCLIKSRADSNLLEEFLLRNEKIISCVKCEDDFFEVLFENTMSFGALIRLIISSDVVKGWYELCLVRKNLEGLPNGQ